MPGSPSTVPSRTPDRAVAMRLNSAEPQSPQKNFSAPLGRFQARMRSSPCTIRNGLGRDGRWPRRAVPVRRWQRVQWQ